MQLTVFNGSPRGKNSNSSVITSWFTKHFEDSVEIDTHYLTKVGKHTESINAFKKSDTILWVTPLYVDGMPGQIKHFIEKLSDMKGQCQDKKIVFIIHSGFQETIQNRALERYLNRLCNILGIVNHTVVILPGSEGFRLMPEQMLRKKSELVGLIGSDFIAGSKPNAEAVKKLQKYETMSSITKLFYRFLNLLGLTNMYWNSNLKANNAYNKRFDAPYEASPVSVTTDAYWTNIC